MARLPAVSGKQLIKLLKRDGWIHRRRGNHGLLLTKKTDGETRVTTVPDRSKSLPASTLGMILSPLQTALGSTGLQRLIDEYGVK